MRHPILSGIGIVVVASMLLPIGSERSARAHCQVPCGIYDDHARIAAMLEDVVTIDKAMNKIRELGGSDTAQDINQMVRWVNTKEQHAAHIITTVSEYFLTQKVKDVPKGQVGYDKYLASLATHHRVLRSAMKTKQTVDSANAEKLRAAIVELGVLYGYKLPAAL